MAAKEKFDAIVVGAGVLGSSTAYHLAKKGRSVLLLEQFEIAHSRGQSYGESRAFSIAYNTIERVKLALQSMAQWRELEHESGKNLLFQTGGIDIVETEEERRSILVTSSDVMWAFGIDFEEWGYGELRRKLPMWRLPESAHALYSPGDGILMPTRTVAVLAKQAKCFGAVVKDREPVIGVFADGTSVEVTSAKNLYSAKNLILTCGAWTNKVLTHLNYSLPIQTSQEQTVYFRPKTNTASFTARAFPVWHHYKKPLVYGFPIFNELGIKVSFHHDGFCVDLSESEKPPRDSVTQRLHSYLEEYLPDAAGEPFEARTCFYDNTPDKNPVVGRLPGTPNVLVGAGSSGHGFNSAIAIGRALADFVCYDKTEIAIDKFCVERFFTGQSSS